MVPNGEEELAYLSSAPLLVDTDDLTVVQDEEDLPTLAQVLKLIKDRKKYYRSIDSLDLSQTEFKLKQQAFINKQHILHLQELETMITSAINKVKEKQQNG